MKPQRSLRKRRRVNKIGIVEGWKGGVMEKQGTYYFSGYCLFPIFHSSSIPLFHYSNLPMFDVLGWGYAALGSLWVDFDNTFNKGG